MQEQKLPAADQPALVERKRQIVPAHFARHRRQGFKISKQIAHVVELHVLVGRIGKRRIEIGAVRRRALPQRGDEIRLAPAADAVIGVGRDIRHIEGTERRIERQAAAKPGAIDLVGILVRDGVARRAATDRRTWCGRYRDWAYRAAAPRRERRPAASGTRTRQGPTWRQPWRRARAFAMSACHGLRHPNLCGIPATGKHYRKAERRRALTDGRPHCGDARLDQLGLTRNV